MADDHTDHDGHDPLLIAALLDRDASATERAEADDRRRSCPDCAALYADLLALAGAVQELPAPVRVRDFALTAADADRLSAERAGEPGLPATRLTGVMTMRPDTAGHAGHDTMLVASLTDHSLGAADRAAAEALIETCDRCAELHADLEVLVVATRRLPTPARPHDYALTAGQAARLRSPWRRLLGAIGSPRDALTKPLAVGLTTLGIAGLLVTAVPSMSFGGASSAGSPFAGGPSAATSEAGAPARVGDAGAEASGVPDLTGDGTTAGAAAAASSQPQPAAAASTQPQPAFLPDAGSSAPGRVNIQGQPQPTPQTVVAPLFNGSAKAIGSGDAGSPLSDQQGTQPGSGPSLSLISAALLAVGLALFGIRRAARRVGDR